MLTDALTGTVLALALGAGPIAAQPAQSPDAAPLSAIDWLSDSITTPAAPPPAAAPAESDISSSALPEPVTTLPIDGALPDSVGLMSHVEARLPRDLWGASPAGDIAGRLRAEPLETLPQIQALLTRILLARLDPPVDASADTSLFVARVDRLLQLGRLSEAEALLEAAPYDNPRIFRRAFDVALLNGSETEACKRMRDAPAFSPTYTARIFCLARLGDWQAAALTLESANAIGILTPAQDDLMARFLDPELFGDEPAPRPPRRPSPLTYRLYEAIGEPAPSAGLPIAFAHAELRPTTGWKARIEAAERLAETGALPARSLFDLYREARPSASGGLWERAAAIQRLDAALAENDAAAITATLPAAWAEMERARLEHPFAVVYGPRVARRPLGPEADALAFRLGLLSDRYRDIAESRAPRDPDERFLIALARGIPAFAQAGDPLTRAVRDGFLAAGVPPRYRALVAADKTGEALLAAVHDFSEGAFGDFDQITDALALLRAMGLEEDAVRASLELLILERRG